MSLKEVLMQDRRLALLRTLSEMPGYKLNEDVLCQALDRIGHPETTKDLVRADSQYLSDHNLARIEPLKMPSGELWVVHLTGDGLEVAEGRPHPGIARLKPLS